jgi:uncharacterized protein YndB with AHSA1/START domain
MDYEIISEIEVDGMAGDVYRALTEDEAIRSWWTGDVKVEPDEEADLELGFYNRAIVLRLVVEDTYPDGRVDWRCIEGPAEYQDCTIVFRIEPSQEKILVEVTHRGEYGTEEFAELGRQSWDSILKSLKSYVESGDGHPLSE